MANKKEAKGETITIKVEWIIWGILIIALILSIITRGFSQLPYNLKLPFANILGETAMDKDAVKEKVTKYINEELLQGQAIVEITEITDDPEDNLYKIILNIGGQEYESYVSKDGKYLYTERMEVTTPEEVEEVVADYPKQDIPDILLFTMSYCPYGNVAEEFVRPVYDLLKDKANIEPHYVIYSKDHGYEGEEYCLDPDNNYCSMHGIGELNQDVRELCVFKYQKDKFWDFVMAANTECTSNDVDECWEEVAKNIGIDIEQIKSCQANEAIALLEEEVKLNQEYDVSGSPTIIVNGKVYEGERSPESFKKAVCSSFNQEPEDCAQTLDETESSSGGSCN